MLVETQHPVIMKLIIPKTSRVGFTLIELLIVIGIIALLATITIPSYISFSRSQELKQSGLNLKNNLRDAQNRALSSEKSATDCGQDSAGNTLKGFYATFIPGNTNISIGGICGNISFNPATSSFSQSSTIQGFVDGTTCQAVAPSGKLTVFFLPLAGGTQFYDGDSGNIIANSPPLTNSKIAIVLTNTIKNYYVMISSSGDINEKNTCP